MIVTPAQAGVQCKGAWIPACAGMTGGKYSLLLNIFFRKYFWDTTLVDFQVVLLNLLIQTAFTNP
jgi:hypothetical protein